MKDLQEYINESIDSFIFIAKTENKNSYFDRSALAYLINTKMREDDDWWFSKKDIKPLLSLKTQEDVEKYLKEHQKEIIHPLYDYLVSEGTDGKNLKKLYFKKELVEDEDAFIKAFAQAFLEYKLNKLIKI